MTTMPKTSANTSSLLMAGVLIGAALAGACGLIDPDITSVRFGLPPRSYSFDTTQAGWNFPVAQLPSIPCSEPTACCTAATAVGFTDCARVICDDASGTCAVTAVVETPPQSINLKEQVPELSSFNSQSAIDVTISKITYDVTVNTLNVPLPPVELFVAPDGTASTTSAAATKFGTVPMTPAATVITNGDVALTAAGQQAFVVFAHNFGTPFVFMGRVTVVVPGGTPLPTGAASVTIKGQLSAKIGL